MKARFHPWISRGPDDLQLSLDDPIRRYVPEFDIRVPPHVKNGKDEEVISQLTIRTLLQQRSGKHMRHVQN